MIDNYAFADSIIESFTIPTSFKEFKNDWCINTPNLNRISVMSQNNNFLSLDRCTFTSKKRIFLHNFEQISNKYIFNKNHKLFNYLIYIVLTSIYNFINFKI